MLSRVSLSELLPVVDPLEDCRLSVPDSQYVLLINWL